MAPRKVGDSAVGEENAPTVIPVRDESTTAGFGAGGEDDGDTAFAPKDLVANRYRIRRFIAIGGMGEVYEAEDTVLHGKVALKTIRPASSRDDSILERFKREILLARRVTHPNVCRMFDLGVHAPPGQAPQTFLTMELLEGPTLADRLRMGRRFTVAEAAPIVAQMAAALDSAHKEGIVHRDFKSGNVLLCPDEKGKGPRAVVTDFGLARSDGDPFTSTVTGNLGLMGTPAYMAPEQVEGSHVGPAADIYALGVVMFEMLTGQLPFRGANAMACAAERLKAPAPSPRVHVPDLDPVWEAVIGRCLERRPEDRFASASEVAKALADPGAAMGPADKVAHGSDSEARAREAEARARAAEARARAEALAAEARAERDEKERQVAAAARRRARRRLTAIAGTAAVVVAVGGILVFRRGHAPPAAALRADGPSRRAIAVLGFKNLSAREDLGWLSTAFAEMMTTELAAGNELRTIPGESLARMKRDLSLVDADAYAPDTLALIRSNVGADYVVVGSFVPLGNQVRVDVRLQDTGSGETLAQIAETGSESELAGLVGRAGSELRDKLAVGPLNAGEQAIVNAALPSNSEAARLYADGLAKSRLLFMRAARDLLERSIAIEPAFAPAHVALAEALSYLGYEEPSRAEAKRAFELAARLPEDERLRVEGQVYVLTGAPARAAEAYGKLWRRFPDNVEGGIRYASTQFSSGDEAGGNATVAALRKLPNSEDDPRIFLVLEQAAVMKQDYRALKEAAAKLAASGTARGALSLVAEARQAEALALWFEGDLASAIAAADKARELAFTIGDRDGVSAALTTKGWVLTERSSYADARRAADEALEVAAEVGSRRRVWAAEHVLARVGWLSGDLDEARRRYDASRRAAVEVGTKYGEALAKLGLAVTDGLAGDLTEAKPIYAELTIGFRLFAPLHNMAVLLHYYGDLQVALGDLTGARKSYDEALTTRQKIGEALEVRRSQVALATLDLIEDKPIEAERLVRAALPFLDEHRLVTDGATARSVLARALSVQGKTVEAQAALTQALAQSEGSEDFGVHMHVALARGEVVAASGPRRIAEALEVIEAAATRATAKGYLGYAYELDLARARLLERAGKREAARQALAQLSTEASRRGFARVASLARSGLK